LSFVIAPRGNAGRVGPEISAKRKLPAGAADALKEDVR
jgi:hypothetical protein